MRQSPILLYVLVTVTLLLWTLATRSRAHGQYGEPPQRDEDRLVVQLEADVAGSEAEFRWNIAVPAGEQEDLTCTLDVDGDAVLEHSIPDCDERTRFTHTYDEAGTYTATLLVRSRSGRSGQSSVRVTAAE